MIHNPRVGQVWILGTQVEIILGWDDSCKKIHKTYTIDGHVGPGLDYIHDETLDRIENGDLDYFYEGWCRIV